MEANELRIGNIITDEYWDTCKTIIRVDSINKDGIDLEVQDDGNWSELAQHFIAAYYRLEALRGIPLNKETMAFCKLGGLWKLEADFVHGEIVGYGLFIKGLDWTRTNQNSIKYIHQLQNLFFGITGHELEVAL